MRRRTFVWSLIALWGAGVLAALAGCARKGGPTSSPAAPANDAAPIALPAPAFEGQMSVEAALRARRSVRNFANKPLTLAQAGQLLWAAQGVTHANGYRAAPSAGATYPLETYLVAGAVEGLAAGLYRYLPAEHALRAVASGDLRAALTAAALGQSFIADAPISLCFAAIYERTSQRYGYRANPYVHMEIGHAGENVYLQAQALGLATVAVGAFTDDQVARVLRLPKDEKPLYLMPVGWRSH